MALLFLQGGAVPPREGIGRLVHELDWPLGLVAPALDEEWLAQPFQDQLDSVTEWLEEATAAVGFGWGAYLLLCAQERELRLCDQDQPMLLLSCFLNRGRFTGQASNGYRLPRADRIRKALESGGRLSNAGIRFVHGTADALAPPEELEFLGEAGFSVNWVASGHGLRGAGEEAVRKELRRLKAQIVHQRTPRSLVDSGNRS